MGFFKKIFFVSAAVISALSLSACEGQNLLTPKAPELNKLFNFSANVICDSGNFSAAFKRTAIGEWEVVMTEPYELQGIVFSYSKGAVNASLEDLNAESLTKDFADSPVVSIIEGLESAVQDGGASVIYGSDNYTVNSKGAVMSFPQGSGVPNGFEISEKRIKGEITEFSITDEVFKDGAEVVLVV